MSLSKSELLKQLRQMDEYEFEELVADLWEARGWDTTVTSGSSDRGIDVIAEKDGLVDQKMLIQAKRYGAENKVGSPDVREYSSLQLQEEGVDTVVIVTTSSFSSQAQKIADKLNVKLINGSSFAKLVLDVNQSKNILGRYENTNNKQGIKDTGWNKENLPDWQEIESCVSDLTVSTNKDHIVLEHPSLSQISDQDLKMYLKDNGNGVGINHSGYSNRLMPSNECCTIFLVTDKKFIYIIGGKSEDTVKKFYKYKISGASHTKSKGYYRVKIKFSNKLDCLVNDEIVRLGQIYIWLETEKNARKLIDILE